MKKLLNMKKTLYFLGVILLLSSCGVVTRTRYGNGLKLNLGNRWTAAEKKQDRQEKKAPMTGTIQSVLPPSHASEDFRTEDFDKNTSAGTILTGCAPLAAPELKPEIHRQKQADKKVYRPIVEKILQKNKTKTVNTIPEETSQEYYRPVEPNVKVAGWLFLLAILMSALAVPLVGGIAALISYILCWIGLGNINRSMGALRGKGLAVTIIVLYSLALLFTLFFYLFLLAWLL